MTITKKPAKVARTAAEFIAGAPDSENARRGVLKGKKRQITLTIMPELLEKVDAMARKLGQSRAAVINMAVYRVVEHGLSIDGLDRGPDRRLNEHLP